MRTTEPILGLLVLILMHFSFWIQKCQLKFEFPKFFEKKLKILACRLHWTSAWWWLIYWLQLWCTNVGIVAFFSPSQEYSKNPWTITRLVCTHFNVNLMLNPNMVMTAKQILNFLKKVWQKWPIVCARYWRGKG